MIILVFSTFVFISIVSCNYWAQQNEDCKSSSFDSIVFAFEDLNFVNFEFQPLQLV